MLLSQQFAGQANLNLSSISAHSEEDSNSSLTYSEQNLTSPMFSQSSSGNRCSLDSEGRPNFDLNNAFYSELPGKIDEDKNMREAIFDKFVKEEQVMKIMGQQQAPPGFFPQYPPNSPFGPLQQQATDSGRVDQDLDDIDSISSSSTSEQKLSEDYDELIERDENGQPKNKRLRTRILPEQLDYLYQKYQIESIPSQKMLEQIAAKVGLRKRVVQVWFQNKRARERKGHNHDKNILCKHFRFHNHDKNILCKHFRAHLIF